MRSKELGSVAGGRGTSCLGQEGLPQLARPRALGTFLFPALVSSPTGQTVAGRGACRAHTGLPSTHGPFCVSVYSLGSSVFISLELLPTVPFENHIPGLAENKGTHSLSIPRLREEEGMGFSPTLRLES